MTTETKDIGKNNAVFGERSYEGDLRRRVQVQRLRREMEGKHTTCHDCRRQVLYPQSEKGK